jgi:hypothetical protein
LAARAIQAVVDPLGRADIEARDDEAAVEAQHRRLNSGDGAPFAIPGLCLVVRLGVAVQNWQVRWRVAGYRRRLVDFSGEWLGAERQRGARPSAPAATATLRCSDVVETNWVGRQRVDASRPLP